MLNAVRPTQTALVTADLAMLVHICVPAGSMSSSDSSAGPSIGSLWAGGRATLEQPWARFHGGQVSYGLQ